MTVTGWHGCATNIPAASPKDEPRYATFPMRSAFFRGEDPLALIEALPGLIAIDLRGARANRAFDTINPFTCALEIVALSNADAETITRMLGGVSDQIEVVALDNETSVRAHPGAVAAGPIDPRSPSVAAA